MEALATSASGRRTPTQKLDVDGQIRMRNQTIAADSADTVATKGYVDSKVAGESGTRISCDFPGKAELTATDVVEYRSCYSSCGTGFCPGSNWRQSRKKHLKVTCSNEGYISSVNSVFGPWGVCYCVGGCTGSPGPGR